MSFLSQSGQALFRTQAAAGTYQADTGTAGLAVRTRSGFLNPTRDLLIPDPEIGGGRDITQAYLGAVSFTGEYAFYGRFNMLPFFLAAALGSTDTIATATGISTHTIVPGTVNPWLSIEQAVGNGFEVFNYTDAKINTFHLEAAANGYLMGTVGVIAKKQTSGNTKTAAPVWDTTPMAVGTNITISYNGVNLPAQSFSFDVNNNIESTDFRLGSLFLGDVPEKRREITMGATIRPQDAALWKQANYGISSATTPGGLPTMQQVVITISSYENIPAGTPVQTYSMTITVPNAILRPATIAPSGDDVISTAYEIQALQPVPATPILTGVVKNAQATAF